MARRSGRLSSTHTNGSSPATASHSRKRGAAEDTNLRASKVAKGAKSGREAKAVKRSSERVYDDATGLTSDDASDEDGEDDEDSDFGDKDVHDDEDDAEDSQGEDSLNDDDDESEPESSRRRQKKSTSKQTHTYARQSLPSRSSGTELWREGATTGLEPGTEVIIKKPKARPAGKTPYTDDTIHPNTMLFLDDLKRNNEREWLKLHDPDFRQSEKDFRAFIEVLTEKLIEVDDTVPELPVKDIVYRIYRDVRFSKDQTPYKSYFSAAWSRTGRKGPYGVYYLQIAPGRSFFGGGCWHPEAQALSRLRDDIHRHPRRIKDVLMESAMRKEFLKGAPDKPEKVVRAFVSSGTNTENALKTRPKGYDKDHKDIALLKLRNFTVGRSLSDDEVLSPKFAERVTHLMSVLKPYVTYLNDVVMPDPTEQDDDDDDDDSQDDDDEEE